MLAKFVHTGDDTSSHVAHKKHVEPPKAEFMREDRGKKMISPNLTSTDFLSQRINVEPRSMNPPDSRSTRFAKGFQRRLQKDIQSDFRRLTDDAALAELRVVADAERREYLTKMINRTGLNPITGGKPIVGDAFQKKEVFRPMRRTQASIREVTHPSKDIEQAELVRQVRAKNRQDRIVLEGLTGTKKDWSVGQQMKTCDGIEFPTPNGSNKIPPLPPRKSGRKFIAVDHKEKESIF